MHLTIAPDDQQLLQAFARRGDEAAFRQIVDRHARWLFAAAFRQLRDRHLAEDAVQVVFLVLARRAHSMNARQKLSGWLFNTLHFTVRNSQRTERNRLRHELSTARPDVAPIEPDAQVSREAIEQLDAAVAKLPEIDRAAIVLRFHQEMPFRQVGDALGTTEDAARKRVDRAPVALRRRLGPSATASMLSASVAVGLDQAPSALAHVVASSVLAAKAGAALPPALAGAAKGVSLLMAAAKIQAVAVAALVFIAVAVPAGVVTWRAVDVFAKDAQTPVAAAAAAPAAAAPGGAAAPVSGNVTVGGVVRDEAKNPLNNVAVHLEWTEPAAPSAKPKPQRSRRRQADVRTDAEGRWEYTPVPAEVANDVRVSLTLAKFADEDQIAPSSGKLADKSAEFVMVRGVVITGVVQNEQGKPIAGAKVSTIRTWYVSNDGGKTVTTDSEGKFAMPPRKPGATSLTVTAKGYAPDLPRVDAAVGMEPVKFTLSPGRTLRVRVVNEDGNPIANAIVTTRRWRGMSSLKWEGRTDHDGHFVMPDAPSDGVEFDISQTGYQSLMGARDAQFTAGDTERTVTMKTQPVFSGMVVDADTAEPIQNFEVIAGWVFWQGHPPFFTFDHAKKFTDGSYKMTMDGHSEVLAYHVRVEADGYVPLVSEPIQKSGTYDFALHRGQDVRGRVIDAEGHPVAKAQVLLALPGAQVDIFDNKLPDSHEVRRTETDANGEFRFRPQAGRFHLVAVVDGGYAISEFDKQPAGAIDLKLSAWSRVTGTYPTVGTGGEPIHLQTWLDRVQSEREREVRYQWSYGITTNAGGEFSMDRVPGFDGKLVQLGIGRFSVDAPSDRRWIPMRLSPGQTVNADLQGATVVGRATKAGGGGSSGVPVRVELSPLMPTPARDWPVDWSAQSELPRPLYLAEFHGAGEFKLGGVRPGKYLYEVALNSESESLYRAIGTVDVPADDAAGKIDLGEVVCNSDSPLPVGEPLPKVLGHTLDEAPISLDAFAGKFVVVALWDGDSKAIDEIRPPLIALGKQFDGSPKVALLALNLEATYGGMNGIVHRPGQLQSPGWTDGYVPQLNDGIVYKLGGPNQPSIVIAGPDGKILARDVALKDAGATVQQFIAAGDK